MLSTKIHVAVDALGMPAQFDVTSGTVTDCVCAQDLISGIFPKYLLVDRGYDTQSNNRKQ